MDLAGWAGRCLHGASALAAHVRSPSFDVVPAHAPASVMWEFETYTSGHTPLSVRCCCPPVIAADMSMPHGALRQPSSATVH